MFRSHAGRSGWVFALALGLSAAVAKAQEYRHRHVPLDAPELPSGILFFFSTAISDSGKVYGTAYALGDGDFLDLYVAVYEQGVVSFLHPGIARTANNRGTVGGAVLIDPESFVDQAALFHGDRVELIPPQPGLERVPAYAWAASCSRPVLHGGLSRVVWQYRARGRVEPSECRHEYE
jgi:hypothetical protein